MNCGECDIDFACAKEGVPCIRLAPPAAFAPAVPTDAALNTLAKMFHNGEEIEGDDGAAMMVDMALWNEACEAFESLIGEGDSETLASSAAPVVREPLTDEQFNDLVMEHLGPHALTGGKMSVYDAFLLAVRATERAHGIGGGVNG